MSRGKAATKTAVWGGFDLSTTGLALGVRTREGEEAYAQAKMQGATSWKGQPAFALEYTPRLILNLLDDLERLGWNFSGTAFSWAVRQHDMVLLDASGQLLVPALSWQCNAAGQEVRELRQQGAEAEVGRVEERFILPKLMWALRKEPRLKKSIAHVMTTGDWIAYLLTGKLRLSTSDALSNGLLVQKTKRLADAVMQRAKLQPAWFPTVIQSGRIVGQVAVKELPGADETWMTVKQRLAGSPIISALGDNHATGVGCGLQEDDFETIVVSAGTSGTINRVCPAQLALAGHAACFEYYKNRLLLMMLADCCKWYDRFIAQYAPSFTDRLNDLNAEIEKADLNGLCRVLHSGGKETYPPQWNRLTVGQQAASTQLSIMLELLLLVRAMLGEVPDAKETVSRFVLTGGLSQSSFFQQVFHAGVQLLNPKARLLISARQGPLRYQTAAYGALLNAMRPSDPKAATKLCPTRSAARPDAATRQQIQYLLKAYGLAEG
ncbi:MAG: FGGY family carbohydrate kinase [Pirellulaceae bacterium]